MVKKTTNSLFYKSEVVQAALMQQLMHGVSILQDGVHKFANKALADMTGYSMEELIGMPYLALVAPEDKKSAQDAYETSMKKNTGALPTFRGELKFMCKDGAIKHVEVYDTINKLSGKKALVSVVQDNSIRKRTEKELRETDQRFTAFIKNFPGITFLKDRCGKYIYTNSRYDEMMHHKYAGPGSLNFSRRNRWKYVRRLDHIDKLVLKELKTVIKTERVWEEMGLRYWLVYRFPIIDEKGAVSAIGGMGIDITERRSAELELRESRKRLSALNADIIRKEEEIAAHIGREIHDELGQMLTLLKFDLAWLGNMVPSEHAILLDKIKVMSNVVDQTIQSVVRLTSELRPRLLDDLGLVAAVRWYVGEFEKRTGIKCRLSVEPEELHLERTLSTTVFRIMQESLTNIAKHSQATKADIELKKSHNVVTLNIADNGIGITLQQIDSPVSFGLLGMQERASSAGGFLKISKGVNRGTKIEVRLPNR